MGLPGLGDIFLARQNDHDNSDPGCPGDHGYVPFECSFCGNFDSPLYLINDEPTCLTCVSAVADPVTCAGSENSLGKHTPCTKTQNGPDPLWADGDEPRCTDCLRADQSKHPGY